MFSKYFEGSDVRPEFNKEFISLWPGWLGKVNLHKLDAVTEFDWSRFNSLLRLISKQYEIFSANFEKKELKKIQDIGLTLATYQESINKDCGKFSNYVIPELDCVLSEEWDYTYIIWYRNKELVEELKPIIKEAGLYSFRE